MTNRDTPTRLTINDKQGLLFLQFVALPLLVSPIPTAVSDLHAKRVTSGIVSI